MSRDSASAGVCSGEAVISNAKGLHARAAAKFVRCAERFDAEIRVTREGQSVPGTSILGLMMLAAGQGNAIVIETRGAEAQQALEALVALVEGGFEEQG